MYVFALLLAGFKTELSKAYEFAAKETAAMIDQTKILTRSEITAVFAELRRKRRSTNTRQNSVIFRLATCCGLRVSEICGLTLANVKISGERPHLVIPKAIAKRKRNRRIPLWWDASTLAELQAWKQERIDQGASLSDPFVCSQAQPTFGKLLSVRNAQNRWRVAIKVLGRERKTVLSVHCGRHSFCSHALAGGRSLAEVRDAAGHANISTTSLYLHAVNDEDETIGSLFDFAK